MTFRGSGRLPGNFAKPANGAGRCALAPSQPQAGTAKGYAFQIITILDSARALPGDDSQFAEPRARSGGVSTGAHRGVNP